MLYVPESLVTEPSVEKRQWLTCHCQPQELLICHQLRLAPIPLPQSQFPHILDHWLILWKYYQQNFEEVLWGSENMDQSQFRVPRDTQPQWLGGRWPQRQSWRGRISCRPTETQWGALNVGSTMVVALTSVVRSETHGTWLLRGLVWRLTDYLLPSSALLQCRTQWCVHFPHSPML